MLLEVVEVVLEVDESDVVLVVDHELRCSASEGYRSAPWS